MRFRTWLVLWSLAAVLCGAPLPARAADLRQAGEPPAPGQGEPFEPAPADLRYPSLFPQAPGVGEAFRHIDVSLRQQQLVAYEGKTPVRAFAVSTGALDTPTPAGHYTIQQKYSRIDLIGESYYYHDVPHVMLLARPFYIHAAPWRDEFGVAASRGWLM